MPDLIPVNLKEFHHFEISETCELRKYIQNKLGVYVKGQAYSQFTCATEDIGNHKEILLMDKVYYNRVGCHGLPM